MSLVAKVEADRPAERLRIVHMIPNTFSGGAQQQLSYLAREQRRNGHDVGIVFLGDGPKRARMEASGAWLHQIAGLGNHDPRIALRLHALLRNRRPDVVQTWLLQMDVMGGLAARWADRAWILSERASGPAYPSGLKVALRARVARHADAIVSNSDAGDRYWASAVGPRVLRKVVRNGIPEDDIAAAPRVAETVVGLPPGHKMVLHAGRFDPQKNLETLVPALAALAERIPATSFLCGDGVTEAETRRQIAERGLDRVVRAVGYVDEVWGWMKRADAFVSVSHFEGHPNAVLEAAACGCPLVLSDIPEHREILNESQAVFVSKDSPAAVTDAIENVLRHPEGARTRAEAARAQVASLSCGTMARRYDEIYREVIARRAHGGN